MVMYVSTDLLKQAGRSLRTTIESEDMGGSREVLCLISDGAILAVGASENDGSGTEV